MALNCVKKYSVSLSIKEIEMKTALRFSVSPIRLENPGSLTIHFLDETKEKYLCLEDFVNI